MGLKSQVGKVPVIKRMGHVIISFPDEKIMEEILKEANIDPDELEDVGEDEND
jgi:hypothetical protein